MYGSLKMFEPEILIFNKLLLSFFLYVLYSQFALFYSHTNLTINISSYYLLINKYQNNFGNILYFTMHETVGTATSPDATNGIPRVTCRFGKVIYNVVAYRFNVLISLHSLPIAYDRRTTQSRGAVNTYISKHYSNFPPKIKLFFFHHIIHP